MTLTLIFFYSTRSRCSSGLYHTMPNFWRYLFTLKCIILRRWNCSMRRDVEKIADQKCEINFTNTSTCSRSAEDNGAFKIKREKTKTLSFIQRNTRHHTKSRDSRKWEMRNERLLGILNSTFIQYYTIKTSLFLLQFFLVCLKVMVGDSLHIFDYILQQFSIWKTSL